MTSFRSATSRHSHTARRHLARFLTRIATLLEPSEVRLAASESGLDDQAKVDRAINAASLVSPSLRKDARILDVGTRSGANLASLFDAGFANVEGWVESEQQAAALISRHPELSSVPVHLHYPSPVALEGFGEDDFSLAIWDCSVQSDFEAASLANELVRVASSIIAIVAPPCNGVALESALTALGMVKVNEKNPLGDEPATILEFRRMDQLPTLYEFWRQPAPEGNNPAGYIGKTGRSRALEVIISDLPHDARILEVGCNVGRNLAHLYNVGYHDVEGIEINPNAIELLRTTFTQLDGATIHEGPAGEHLPRFDDGEFDLIFTMAVIEHLHPDEATVVFDHMVRAGREILAIEPEGRITHRQYPHDVAAEFCNRGLEMVLSRPMSDYPSNADDPAMAAFTAFRFRRR